MPLATDKVRFCRPERLPGLELVEASYWSRAFPVHSHEEYVIGVMTAGTERLAIRGRQWLVRAGDFILIEPGEAHSNATVNAKGLAYRVFYVPAGMVAEEFGDERFPANVLPGGALAGRLAALHREMMGGGGGPQIEGRFLQLLAEIFARTGSPGAGEKPAEQSRVTRARRYLDHHVAEPVSLADLAAVAGLSPYHLLRSFRDQIGLTPRAYQIQRRVAEARRRLREGAGIADAAAELGFADQSHLSRHFQRIFGTSPGRYAQQ